MYHVRTNFCFHFVTVKNIAELVECLKFPNYMYATCFQLVCVTKKDQYQVGRQDKYSLEESELVFVCKYCAIIGV